MAGRDDPLPAELFVFGKLVEHPGGPTPPSSGYQCTSRSSGFPADLHAACVTDAWLPHLDYPAAGIGAAGQAYFFRPVLSRKSGRPWLLFACLTACEEGGKGRGGRVYLQAMTLAVPAEQARWSLPIDVINCFRQIAQREDLVSDPQEQRFNRPRPLISRDVRSELLSDAVLALGEREESPLPAAWQGPAQRPGEPLDPDTVRRLREILVRGAGLAHLILFPREAGSPQARVLTGEQRLKDDCAAMAVAQALLPTFLPYAIGVSPAAAVPRDRRSHYPLCVAWAQGQSADGWPRAAGLGRDLADLNDRDATPATLWDPQERIRLLREAESSFGERGELRVDQALVRVSDWCARKTFRAYQERIRTAQVGPAEYAQRFGQLGEERTPLLSELCKALGEECLSLGQPRTAAEPAPAAAAQRIGNILAALATVRASDCWSDPRLATQRALLRPLLALPAAAESPEGLHARLLFWLRIPTQAYELFASGGVGGERADPATAERVRHAFAQPADALIACVLPALITGTGPALQLLELLHAGRQTGHPFAQAVLEGMPDRALSWEQTCRVLVRAHARELGVDRSHGEVLRQLGVERAPPSLRDLASLWDLVEVSVGYRRAGYAEPQELMDLFRTMAGEAPGGLFQALAQMRARRESRLIGRTGIERVGEEHLQCLLFPSGGGAAAEQLARQRAEQEALKAAASYLERCPPAIAWELVRGLIGWIDLQGGARSVRSVQQALESARELTQGTPLRALALLLTGGWTQGYWSGHVPDLDAVIELINTDSARRAELPAHAFNPYSMRTSWLFRRMLENLARIRREHPLLFKDSLFLPGFYARCRRPPGRRTPAREGQTRWLHRTGDVMLVVLIVVLGGLVTWLVMTT